MKVRHGNPTEFWGRVECALREWENVWSPARWPWWRTLFWRREGLYLLVRCVLLGGALATVAATDWQTSWGTALRVVATTIAVLFLLDIVVTHASIAFVSRSPENLLRSAVLAIFSFFQISLAFAVFYLSSAGCFNVGLTWDRALYFSVVTATTLGYGDIAPKPEATFVQFVIVAELVTSVAFLSIIVARLIDLTSSTTKT